MEKEKMLEFYGIKNNATIFMILSKETDVDI